MPSALPGQNDYYARHRRQQSSMSQNSLPDQLKNSIAAAYSPNRSAVLLPATIYGQTHQETPHSPRLFGTLQSSGALSQFDGTSDDVPGGDPDEFYRHYQTQFSQATGGSLRQGAIWTTESEQIIQAEGARKSSFASSTSETRGGTAGHRQSSNSNDHSRTQINLPGLRARKSSVKNLVAQFDASATEEVPPLPVHSISRPASRNVSPVISGGAQFQQFSSSRNIPTVDYNQQQYHGNGVPAAYTNQGVPLNLTNTPHISEIQTTRRPLFGEILSGSPQTISLGHGIRDWRLRRGSEGSPVTANNPVFPLGYGTQNSVRTEELHHKSRDIYDANISAPLRPSHRRVNSASPSISTDTFPGTNAYAASRVPQTPVRHNRTQGSISRIPISTRTTGMSPTTETQSLDKAASSIELRITSASSPVTPKRSSPRRKQRSPTHIQSPGKRGKSVGASRADRSPLLRANIIVPPPKVSPPLRSSRPRVPVSNASTAASRARMAEKFNAMQKLNNEKRVTVRRHAKPPELTDIDLKARRLRITQALSRSLEGQDLKGEYEPVRRRNFSTSRTASPAVSERSQWTDSGEVRNGVPAVMIDHGAANSNDESETFHNSVEDVTQDDRGYTQNALQAMQSVVIVNDNSNDDSPTLGRGETKFNKQPSPLQTDFLFTKSTLEPSSALTDITVETQGTNIDPEPQSAAYEPALAGRSLLSHVTQMRSQTPTSPDVFSPADGLSDHGDQESVHLILRDTTYFPDPEDAETGYQAMHSDMTPSLPHAKPNHRDSWTSSIEDYEGHEEYDNILENNTASANDPRSDNVPIGLNEYFPDHGIGNDDSIRSTMASDAYTIVNIVLQRHSTNGIVDQQFVDEVYQEVLKNSPYESEGTLNTSHIEQLCLKEIQTREENWRRSIITGRKQSEDAFPKFEEIAPAGDDQYQSEKVEHYFDHDQDPLPLPQPAFKKNHRHKSSLDSAEDWADTSPSVSDWMRFAHGDNSSKGVGDEQITPVEKVASDITLTSNHFLSPTEMSPADSRPNESEDTDLYGTSSSRKPTQPLISLALSRLPSIESSTHGQALIEPPEVPRRITSLSQMTRQPPPVPLSLASTKVASAKTSTEEVDSPEQRRLKRRRHVIKELVDTEFTYEKDLRVLCDIYKQTAPAALSDDDIRVLFGNVEQIQVFSRDFLMLLKSAAKPTYIMERPDRKKDKGIDSNGPRPQSSSSTLASKTNENEIPSAEKDKETRVGHAFESSLADMERVYAGYIRNRQAANQRLEAVQKSLSAREWLKECRDNSSDITNAWNLDALLVKPVQRITKYPLLLKELVESTPEDHPDGSFLRRALHEVTEVNVRINDVKKHTELVDQVLNRKRKDSDVRVGLSKAFGRRAEKLRQHVGIADMYEDNQYNEAKIHYDNNIVQLMVVGNDCSSYGRAVTKWVTRMVEIASAAEAWVDVGHSNHQEAESKLRQFAMVTRGISTIALPAHIEQLENKVLRPMQQAVDSMNRFKNDPKGLLQMRDKRLIDYAQARNKREKGERVDKKIVERMEQWEALNTEAKQRMGKLIKATAKLVRTCQVCLIQMQMDWLSLVKTKLSVAMAISLDHLNVDHIKNDWQMDFDFQEASALSLSICNGALLAEAINMVNFQTPSTTINGEDSPRQTSFSTKRSISLHSDGSHVHIPDPMPRNNQQTRHQYDNPNERSQLYGSGFSSSRERAASATSNHFGRTPDPSIRNGTSAKHVSASAGSGGMSFGRSEEALLSGPPRLSVDTPSPLIGSLQPDYGAARPPSSSTFFTATADVPGHAHKQSTGSSIFSSAMPMSDSPALERAPEVANREPDVLFTAASVYEFNIDRSRREAGFPYLTYVPGEIFDIIGERGELWLARNQDDPDHRVGWIWHKHFAKLAS